jgi:hypothetical protein
MSVSERKVDRLHVWLARHPWTLFYVSVVSTLNLLVTVIWK